MQGHVAVAQSPTAEILGLRNAQISDYITTKRRRHKLGGIIAKLNHELMFGDTQTRASAAKALEKLGYVLD